MKHRYLGDGLYARDDGYALILYAQREEGVHWVSLDDHVLCRFLELVKEIRGEKESDETP